MTPLLISAAAFVGVAALVGSVAVMFQDRASSKSEDRLATLTGLKQQNTKDSGPKASVLAQPLGGSRTWIEELIKRIPSLQLLFEQANANLTPSSFLIISGVLAGVGWVTAFYLKAPLWLLPPAALAMASLPIFWLTWRRGRRFKMIGAQLPDALELISRALRAGHSLASGFNLVQQEMADPIAGEFGRVFEEQNLGIGLDEALRSLTMRVPNLDLKFFATSVTLQRQTGGDLAEILDKIGHLVRERFRIHGQVQALTGEGRLSGVVLLGLPPVLFLAVFRLNRDYVMTLFTDPMGKQMLAGAVVMQLLGAIVIRKIVNIKV